MKRLFAIVTLFLFLVPCVRADGPDDQYVQIYNLIQEGDSFGPKDGDKALAKYTEAHTSLLRFQKIYPNWNQRVVVFRLNYLASKMTILSSSGPGVPNAPAPIPMPPPPPAPAPIESSVPPKPAAQNPTPLAPVVQSQPPSQQSEIAALQNQIAELRNQVAEMQGEKSLLEGKLREALAARPTGIDPGELTQAQEQIRLIQKENDLLQVSLAQEQERAASMAKSSELEGVKQELAQAKRQLADQTTRATQLEQENESLKTQIKTMVAGNGDVAALRSENEALKKLADAKSPSEKSAAAGNLARQLAQAQATIASLEADKEVWDLEKTALENRVRQLSSGPIESATPLWTQDSERVKQLERERDDLQKKLDTAQRELYGRNGKSTAAVVDELANELETLRARLDIYESKPIPYSPEELALFKKPVTEVTDPNAGKKPVRELPPGTVELVAAAQQDFSTKSYQQAEQKYLEVLRRDEKNINTLANLATIQLEMGHFDDAEKNVKAALAVVPDDAFSLSILGNLKFRQQKYDEALDALSRAAKADPKSAEIQNFLGLTLSEKGMRNAAETAFRKAVILNPNYGGAQNNLAVFYLTQKPPSLELARWHYDKAIAAGFPRNPEMEKMLDEKKAPDSGQ